MRRDELAAQADTLLVRLGEAHSDAKNAIRAAFLAMVAARTGELPLDQLRAAQSAKDFVSEKLRVVSERFEATMRALLAEAAGPHPR